MNILNEISSRESDARARDSFIVSVPQPVSYSFACHVSCKVKYYWVVANVEVHVNISLLLSLIQQQAKK